MVKGELRLTTAKAASGTAYRVRRLWDTEEIRPLLMQDAAFAVFAIGLLEPRRFSAGQWWLSLRLGPSTSLSTQRSPIQSDRTGSGQAEGQSGWALLLHSRGTLGASLFATGDPEALHAVLRLQPGPLFTFATFQAQHLPVIERYFVLQHRHHMQRMVVTKETFRPVEGQARRLSRADTGEINRLYGAEGGYYPTRHIDESVYCGVFAERGHLVSIAGTHLVAPKEGVAVVGNVYTHPRYRGRGYATIATSAVTAELLESCRLVALTVDPDNVPAVRAYERLGYQRRGVLMETAARRKDALGIASLMRRWLAKREGNEVVVEKRA